MSSTNIDSDFSPLSAKKYSKKKIDDCQTPTLAQNPTNNNYNK